MSSGSFIEKLYFSEFILKKGNFLTCAGAGEMAQLANCLAHKHDDLGLILGTHRNLGVGELSVIPVLGRWGNDDWGLLVSQPILIGEPQVP